MATFGYVDSYDNLKKLPPGAFDMVQVDKQKDGLDVLDKNETSVPLLHPNGGIFTWDKNADDSDDGHDIITPNASPSKGRWKRLVDNLSVKWLGAKGDTNEHYIDDTDGIVTRHRGTIILGSNVFKLTSPSKFESNDNHKGKTIVIWKPGLKDGYFVSKINKVNPDLISVELLDSAKVTISDAYVAWGTDDTNAIQKAIDIAERTGLAVYLPPGRYIVTKTLSYNTIEPQRGSASRYWPHNAYPLMKPGLRMFGAGLQVSFIHSLIENDFDKENATIKLDGTGSIGRINFQQTGQLKDFSISSIGYFEDTQLTRGIETIGIDLLATWAYTIENVAVMNMGSDGIIIRNLRVQGGTSDYDQTDKLRLDNVLIFANHGWGIKVDAAEAAASTSKIHFDRCKIEQNEGGGIQWTGLGGVIERCGIYANGVYPINDTRSKTPEKPTAIEGAYGILIKNVKSTSDGLLITGCEIQGNADVQVGVQVGSNIRIVQNDFKVDNLSTDFSFPSMDIQVGDANLGDLHIDYYSTDDKDKRSIILDALPDPYPLDKTEYDSNIIELYGTRKPTKSIELIFPVTKVMEWLIVNHTDVQVRPKGRSVDGSETRLAILWPFSEKSIRVLEKEVTEGGHKIRKLFFQESVPRTVNACVIEDNSIRLSWEGKAWGGDIAPAHTVVKVNSNAVGTMIRGWWKRTWIPSDVEGKYKLVDLVERDPLTHTRLPIYPIVYFGKTHVNTNLHCDGIDGGHVLHPFAYHEPPRFVKQMETYTPDTSRWSYYRLVIDGKGNTKLLIIENPTARTIGTPLFLEFINVRNEYVQVKFGNEYKVGESLVLPPGKTVSGILLFEVGGTWTSFSPWTCDGKGLNLFM